MKSNLLDSSQHDQVINECVANIWEHSVDLMFIMAVEENGEFSLYDNNPASREIMGIANDAPIHRLNIRQTWSDDIVEGLYATYRKAIAAHRPISFEQFATHYDKSIFVNTLFVPIFDENDQPLFVCGVSRDISDIKAAEQMALDANAKLHEYSQALENVNKDLDAKVKVRTQELERTTQELEVALEAKSSFVARMSHEIRTPINAMVGLCNLLKKTGLNETQHDYIDKIIDSGEVLTRLVNDILDVSKLEADMLTIEQIEFDLEQIMRQSVNISNFSAYEKNLELVLQVDPNVPAKLIGDPLRIQQIVINLVSNAIKFTEKGAISLHVGVQPSEHKKQIVLCFDVQDTGIGLSQEQQMNLFQSFSQADGSITRKYGGSGLGLFISQKIANLMGGKITLASELGQGACFTVRIPLGVVQSMPMVARYHQGQGHRVLVVDDLELSRKALHGLLSELAYQVEVARSGFEAIDLIAQAVAENHPFSVILLDWKMPQMDGVQTSRKIKARFKAQTPPILMISAYEKQAIQEHLQSGLISNFIEKPISPSSLFDAVETMLNHHPVSQPKLPEKGLELSDYRILLVEDNTINQQVALGYLEDSGIQVLVAGNGEEALEILAHQRVDLVLMDIQMPKLDGLSTTEYLRNKMQFTQPIIAMTAHVSEGAINECLSCGMNAHIGKPINSMELYQVLVEYLDLSLPESNTVHSAVVHKYPQAGLISQLTDLDLLDVPAALKQLRHRDDLYLSLVETFYKQYAKRQFVDEMMMMTREELADTAHAIKSNTAYIGALSLSSQYAVLEQQLRQEQEIADPVVLFRELERLISLLEPLFSQEVGTVAISPEDKCKLFKEYLGNLLVQLDHSDFAAESTLRAIQSLMKNCPEQSDIDEIMNYVEAIEFEQAFTIAKQVYDNLP
ncbi:response regulator [Celerinatantimonas yamalensis]|uniref:histidine kinase n=1 Tax=Celerinatantimonas yamalensis TaxID=559956 RepID=A0ABW9GB57_9GAMM